MYIDGSNFYGYLKEIGLSKGTFNFNAFVTSLVGKERKLVSKRYYTGIFRNLNKSEKSGVLVKNQQKFLQHLKNDGFVLKRGRIMPIDNVYKEKGTDVKIAVDLVVGAVDDNYDTAILISSDTDIIPAIKYVKYKKKNIEYIGFAHAPSLGIQKYASLSVLLLARDIKKFKKIA